MRKWGTAFAAVALAAFAAGCAGTGPGQSAVTPPAPVMKAMPGLIGKGLATAESDAQAAGFSNLSAHDASGRGRVQILARDWKVCSQAPAAGSDVSTASTVDLGVVKLDETCPAGDQGTASPSPVSEGGPMPDLRGTSLKVAVAALPSSTSITPRDVSGRHRLIIIQSNWKVCSQNPGPAATFNGQPVSFGVVKFGESCP
jgi:hypothetical protein